MQHPNQIKFVRNKTILACFRSSVSDQSPYFNSKATFICNQRQDRQTNVIGFQWMLRERKWERERDSDAIRSERIWERV